MTTTPPPAFNSDYSSADPPIYVDSPSTHSFHTEATYPFRRYLISSSTTSYTLRLHGYHPQIPLFSSLFPPPPPLLTLYSGALPVSSDTAPVLATARITSKSKTKSSLLGSVVGEITLFPSSSTSGAPRKLPLVRSPNPPVKSSTLFQLLLGSRTVSFTVTTRQEPITIIGAEEAINVTHEDANNPAMKTPIVKVEVSVDGVVTGRYEDRIPEMARFGVGRDMKWSGGVKGVLEWGDGEVEEVERVIMVGVAWIREWRRVRAGKEGIGFLAEGAPGITVGGCGGGG